MKNLIDLRKSPEPAESAPVQSSRKIYGEILPHQQAAHKLTAVVISIVCILIGLAYIYFQRNFLTAVFFFLIAFIILVFAFKEKRSMPWEINRHGVGIDTSFFPYREIKSFWIEYEPENIKEISLKSKKWYQGYFKIPLNEESPLKIRELLLEFLPEERHEDTLIETISRKLGI